MIAHSRPESPSCRPRQGSISSVAGMAHGYACSMEPVPTDDAVAFRIQHGPSTSTCWRIRPARWCCSKPNASSIPCPKQCGLPRAYILEPHARLGVSNLDANHGHCYDSPRPYRAKILAFLSQQQKKAGTRPPSPSLQPDQSASYLSTSTAARCRTSSPKLRKEGVVKKAAHTGCCSARQFSAMLRPK